MYTFQLLIDNTIKVAYCTFPFCFGVQEYLQYLCPKACFVFILPFAFKFAASGSVMHVSRFKTYV